jgi:hypothetical protein
MIAKRPCRNDESLSSWSSQNDRNRYSLLDHCWRWLLKRVFLLVALWVLKTTTITTSTTRTLAAAIVATKEDDTDFPERQEHQVVQQDNENDRDDHQEEQEEGYTVESLNDFTEDSSNPDHHHVHHDDNTLRDYQEAENDAEEEEESEGEEEPVEESSSHLLPPLVKEGEIYVLSTLDSIDQLIELSKKEEVEDRYPPLSLIFLHNRSCPHSMKLLRTLEQAILFLHVDIDLLQVYNPHWAVPVVGKMDVDDFYKTAEFMGIPKMDVDQVLAMFQVTSVPKLVFVQEIVGERGEEEPTTPMQQDHDEEDDEANFLSPQFLMLEYTGLQSNPSDLADGLWHYIYRLQFGHSEPIHAARRIAKREKANVLMEEKDENPLEDNEELDDNSRLVGEDHFLNAPPAMVFTDPSQLEELLRAHGRKILSHVSPALDPHWSEQEKKALASLFDLHDGLGRRDDSHDDPFLVVAQCHGSSSNNSKASPIYEYFDAVSNVLSVRRDMLFVILETSSCSDSVNGEYLEDGSVVVYWLDRSWNLHPRAIWTPPPVTVAAEGKDNQPLSSSSLSTSLTNFVTSHITPGLMWMDRQVTAPIAFARHNKVHVVLFVNVHHFHHSGTVHEPSRQAVQSLRRVCQAWRQRPQQQLQPEEDQHLTCLIVPSTDTRILTTFGIDIWTGLDEKVASHYARNPVDEHSDGTDQGQYHHHDERQTQDEDEVLPTLLITDQRGGGTKRYYLDPPSISHSSAISDFVQAFWKGELQWEYASSRPTSRSATKQGTSDVRMAGRRIPINRYGVLTLSAEDFTTWLKHFSTIGHESARVAKEPKHLLLLLYAPTCGHCKRVSIVWNLLSDLLQSMGWDDFVQVAKLDVTTNELFVPEMVVKWLPDVYYIGPQPGSSSTAESAATPTTANETHSNSSPYRLSRYDRFDALGEGVGRVSGTIELIEWFLDVAELDEPGLLSTLDTGDLPP